MKIADRCAPVKVANSAENSVLQALQFHQLKLDITRVTLYSLRTDHAQKTRFYCCVRNITPRTIHVTPNQYCWCVTSCACVEVCLPSRNLETDRVTPLFHCWYVYYLETADSVAQPFLHGANTPHYIIPVYPLVLHGKLTLRKGKDIHVTGR
jgi:hypothetical protein